MWGKLAEAAGALCDLDVAGLSDGELHAAVVEVRKLRCSMVVAAEARLLAEWDARRVWADDGSRTAGARLARETGSDPKACNRDLTRARTLRSMPLTAAALAAGRVGVDKADALCRANTDAARSLFADAEADLVAKADQFSYPDFNRIARYWKLCADDRTEAARAQRQFDERTANASRTFAGGVHGAFYLPALEGTTFLDEFARLADEEYQIDLAKAKVEWGDNEAAAHLGRSAAQRKADALIAMAARSASLRHGGDRGERLPLFTVLVGYETLTARVCETEDGTVIHPSQLVKYWDRAEVERIVFDGPSRVIDVGQRTRTFRGALRRAVQVRDRHCTEPGCHEPMNRCQVDHIIEFEDGGFTTQTNGQLRCGHHNRYKHQRKRQQQASRLKRPPPDDTS